jgi:hypothetical protein
MGLFGTLHNHLEAVTADQVKDLLRRMDDPRFRFSNALFWEHTQDDLKRVLMYAQAVRKAFQQAITKPEDTAKVMDVTNRLIAELEAAKEHFASKDQHALAADGELLAQMLNELKQDLVDYELLLRTYKEEIPQKLYLFHAQEMIEEMQDATDFPQASIEQHLYDLLTLNDPREKANFELARRAKDAIRITIQGFKTAYEKAGINVTVDSPKYEEQMWLSFRLTSMDGKHDLTHGMKVYYKEYFTFVPKSGYQQGIIAEYRKLTERLFTLAVKLKQLAADAQDDIQMKVFWNYRTMIIHSDSIVVHYLRSTTGPLIRDLVESVMRADGLLVARRQDRVKGGFDLHRSKEAFSHSHLITSTILGHIHAEAWPRRKAITAQELARYLQEQVQSVKENNTPSHLLSWRGTDQDAMTTAKSPL